MLKKRLAQLLIFLHVASFASFSGAQQAPTPATPTPAQPPAGADQPPAVPPTPTQAAPRAVSPKPPSVPPTAPAAGTQAASPAPAAQTPPVRPERRLLPSPAPAAGGMVSLNFNRADLIEIIHIIAQQLKLTYTIDPEVKGTVTINSAQPLRAEDLLPIFHQVLRMNGAVAVRTGNLYHIMPIKDGKGLARPVGQSREDSFALQIVPVKFFTVTEMKRILTPLLMPGGEVIEYPRGNFLIVVDLPSNIQRLMEIVDLVDAQVFAGARMEIYQPRVASAEELAQEMIKIMQSFGAAAPQAESFAAQFIALPRINQLLVIAHSEASWAYARRWLEKIDVIAEGPGRRIFIYQVENGKAADLADVLGQALGQPVSGARATSPTLQSLHRATPGGTTQQQQQPGTTGTRGGTTTPFGSSGLMGSQQQPAGLYATVPVPGQPAAQPQPIPAPSAAPGAARPPTTAAPGPKPEEQLRIVADPATNSLIIYGTAQEFQNIRNILKELDAVPRQVLIEALILQVDLKDTEDFGVDYQILTKPRQTIFGRTFGASAALVTLGKLLPASDFSGISGLSGIVGDNTVSALIRVAATDSRIKLISAPSVLASDNRPARIQVGSEEPIPTGTVSTPISTGTGGIGTTTAFASSTTVQYRNTGRILTIIPQVNSQGLVNLQIKAEVSARGDDVTVGQDKFPAFNTQDAETTAVVHDGETLVIGGLIGERRSKGRAGIPYLMDLPVVGRFFGTTNDSNDRTELIMLITPRVIRNRDESQVVTEEFKSKLSTVRNELERIQHDRQNDIDKLKGQPQDQKPVEPKAPSDQPPPPPAPEPISAAPAPITGAMASGAAGGEAAAPLAPQPATASARAEQVPSDRGAGSARVASADAPRGEPGSPSVPRGAATQSAPSVEALARQTDGGAAPLGPSAASKAPERKTEKPQVQTANPIRIWTVQVATYIQEKDAEGMARKLAEKGYDVYITPAAVDGKKYFRVQVGELKSRQQAVELQQRLKDAEKLDQTLIASR